MRRLGLVLALWGGLVGGCSVTPVANAGFPRLQVQDTVAIPPHSVNGVTIRELSGLAWDKDEQLLYAISDKGSLFHFRLELAGNRIAEVQPVYATNLLDRSGNPVKRGRRDAEGLTVVNANNGKRGDTQLVLAFEGEPRLIRFTPQGRAIKNITLPTALRQRQHYQHGNDALEAVTFHPRYGFITAPEMPLKGQPRNRHTLYATEGQRWTFTAYPEPDSAISALETLPNGNLLVLERAWSGIFNPLVVSLRYLDFKRCSPGGECQLQDLQVISTQLLVDNYEGLTHIQGNYYLMVSDDASEPLLRTALTLFTLELD